MAGLPANHAHAATTTAPDAAFGVRYKSYVAKVSSGLAETVGNLEENFGKFILRQSSMLHRSDEVELSNIT